MSDYVDCFRDLPDETLKQRLNSGRLSQKAADAYRQVLAERASFVPFDISGQVSVSGHSGCFYAYVDKDQKIPHVFDGQRDSEFLIPYDVVEKYDLADEDRIVFQVGPSMTWVTEIKSVTKAPPPEGPQIMTMTGPRSIH